MAATEAPLTWSGISGLIDMQSTWSDKLKEEEPMSARLEAAAQAKDAALEDMQRRLNAALEEAEQGRAREAALLRRAQKSEEGEEALASQMAELEAEAFTRITETSKLLAAAVASHAEPITSSHLSIQVKEALEEAAAWARRCEMLEEEGRATAFQRRVEIGAEEAEASQIAELERRLAKAEEALEAAHAKLRQAEEKNWSVEKRLAQGEKAVTLKRKQGGHTVLSVSLEDLAEFVKLKLWNPSSLTPLTLRPF